MSAMSVLSKAQAESAIRSAPALRALERVKVTAGQFKESVIGRTLPAAEASRYALVWAEPRKDRDGEFYVLLGLKRSGNS